MTPEQAHAAAHAEGLVLLPAENPTGFKGVNLGSTVSRPFVAKMWNGSRVDTWARSTGEEAALAIARALGPEGVAAALQAASQEAPPMTAAEALAQAAAEG